MPSGASTPSGPCCVACSLDQGNLLGCEVEETVDDLIDLAFGALYVGCQGSNRVTFGFEVNLPSISLREGHILFECLFHLGSKRGEVDGPPLVQFRGELCVAFCRA